MRELRKNMDEKWPDRGRKRGKFMFDAKKSAEESLWHSHHCFWRHTSISLLQTPGNSVKNFPVSPIRSDKCCCHYYLPFGPFCATITVTVKYDGTPLVGMNIHAKTITYITGYSGQTFYSDVTTDADGKAKIECLNSSKMTKIVITSCYTEETNCYKKASKTGSKTY